MPSWLYRGRCPLRETGKSNYARADAELGVDLVADPNKVAYPRLGLEIALNPGDAPSSTPTLAGGRRMRRSSLARVVFNLGNLLSRAQPNGLAERKA